MGSRILFQSGLKYQLIIVTGTDFREVGLVQWLVGSNLAVVASESPADAGWCSTISNRSIGCGIKTAVAHNVDSTDVVQLPSQRIGHYCQNSNSANLASHAASGLFGWPESAWTRSSIWEARISFLRQMQEPALRIQLGSRNATTPSLMVQTVNQHKNNYHNINHQQHSNTKKMWQGTYSITANLTFHSVKHSDG